MRRARVVAVCLRMLALCGCRQDMFNQPRYKTYAADPFFRMARAPGRSRRIRWRAGMRIWTRSISRERRRMENWSRRSRCR